jgi:nucleotide-binding universal stress UspA family protein
MQFNRVVIAVDFSVASLAAARWVAMQLAPRAELALVHVVSEPVAPSFVRPHLPSFEEVAAELTPALYGALRGLAGVVGSARTTIKLLTGTPANALARFGSEFGADLICLGRRRRRRGAARFGDTTAQRLLAQTRIPVLVVPTARPTLPARILTAVEDQPGNSTELRAATSLAQSYEAALEVLHVLAPELPRLASLALAPNGTPPATAAHTDLDESEPAELYLDGKARLESLTHDWLASQLRQVGNGARRVTTHVRIGDPGEQIVKFVHAASADLVLIGRGRDDHSVSASGSMQNSDTAFPLGSTSRLVLWASPCPVLVLPPAARPAAPEPSRRSDARRLHIGTAA